jgi:two-component system, response regulator
MPSMVHSPTYFRPFSTDRPQITRLTCDNARVDKHFLHKRSGAKGDFILFAEDHGATVELFVRIMRADGIQNEVVVARDGAAALDYLFGSGGDEAALPSLVVLDIGMPRVDGLEVLRRIRADQRTELLPVVVLSANDGISDVSRAYRLGANGFVSKLSDTLPFHDLVPLMVRYWLYANTSAIGLPGQTIGSP